MNLNTNKILSSSEIIKDSIFFDASFEELKKKNFIPVEQTSLEKLNIIKDLLNRIKNKEFPIIYDYPKLEFKRNLDRYFLRLIC